MLLHDDIIVEQSVTLVTDVALISATLYSLVMLHSSYTTSTGVSHCHSIELIKFILHHDHDTHDTNISTLLLQTKHSFSF